MKVFSAALLLVSSAVCVEGKKNAHGFDPGFLKAMNQGAKTSGYLKDVTNYERKQFWKNLMKKAKPATEAQSLRSKKAPETSEEAPKSEPKEQKERKLDNNNNYANYGGQQNYNQYDGSNANQGYNYNNGNAQQYNNGNYQAEDANANANQDYNGNYNYGNNNQQYNYNGNGDGDENYNEQYYENGNDAGVSWDNLGFDMKQYSLKYTGCSAVKTYNSAMAQAGWANTVLSTKRFALFRLCPSNNCNKYSVNGCGRNYGEYVLEMDSFLEGVVEFNRQRYWHFCHFCKRCNGLESYGERMSELSEDQMDYYEQMQAEAEAYYEQQQEAYQQENEEYAQENAANYNYYYNNNGNGGNGGNNNYNYQADGNGDDAAANEDAAANDDGDGDGNNAGYWKNGNYYYNNQYAQNNNDANGDDGNANGGRKVRKLMVPNMKVKKEMRRMRKLYSNYNSNSGNANQNAQYYYYQQKKQEQYQDGDGDMSYEDYQEYMENMNQNMYNPYYWDDEVYGEWSDDWSESWLAFNWQVLPYCSESEVNTCVYADDTCGDYDEDFQDDADAMGGFSACTQIDDNVYIGPHCNDDGYTITLGVYSDAYCDNWIGDQVSLYDVLGYDIDEDFDFFPQECVTCEEGGEEKEFAQFMEANEDFDNYEEWLDQRWEEYIEYVEEQFQENMGQEQAQYYYQQSQYYQAQKYEDNDQQGYYYSNGRNQQNGGGSYYYGNSDQQQQYAQYGGQQYQNQQMAEQYGNYGAEMLNQGMNFYYNRGAAGDWITNEQYDADEWAQEQEEQYGDYYYYKQQQQGFAKSGVADVCGALYTYAAKCNKHLTTTSNSQENMFAYSYGSYNQEANEETVCNFIDNLQSQKYDESGDVITDGSQAKSGYVIDFASTNWFDPDQVKAQAERSGVTAGQAVGLAITMAACLVMGAWACFLHSTMARKNIPWRPRRGKLIDPTDISRQNSGIVMGRSRSGMSGKNAPLI